MTRITLLLCCFFALNLNAQNTMQIKENHSSPKASLNDVAWISGHWQGEAFGGIAEEIWSPPLGNSMMFVFRLVADDKVQFYEIGHIQQTGNTLILQLKHFHGNLKGWEKKDETVDFKFIKMEGNRIYFDGFTIEQIGPNEINMYVLIGHDDGTSEEAKFNYKRVQ